VTMTNGPELFSITYGAGRYVAGGDYGTVWTSPDLVNWTNPAPDLSLYPYIVNVAVAYGNGVFVGVSGVNARIVTSPDGLNWTAQDLLHSPGESIYFSDVTFGNGRFVAVASSAIATSVNGTDWALQPALRPVAKVACGNETFVAVGPYGMLVSGDGENWSPQFTAPFSSITFGGGYFLATRMTLGPYGDLKSHSIWLSSDGVHWSQQRSKTYKRSVGCAYGNGTFVTGGEPGWILQTDPFVNVKIGYESVPRLQVWGPTNAKCRIEYADALETITNWKSLAMVTLSDGSATFEDSDSTGSMKRFYRAVLLP